MIKLTEFIEMGKGIVKIPSMSVNPESLVLFLLHS